jgi:hypothetical protein
MKMAGLWLAAPSSVGEFTYISETLAATIIRTMSKLQEPLKSWRTLARLHGATTQHLKASVTSV